MTGDRALFKEVLPTNGGTVTFGDGSKAVVEGKGSIEILGLPTLTNVLFVNGLKANLLSISQFCDENFLCSSQKSNIFNSAGQWIVKGLRIVDNCYGVSPIVRLSCHRALLDETELWHQRLGHINFRDLAKSSKRELVDGLPRAIKGKKIVCGACQEGKQTRTWHKKNSLIHTSRPLKLLHMDLMGLTQTESVGGKKYIMVIVNDFTRYTWTILFREKSEAFDLAKKLFKKFK